MSEQQRQVARDVLGAALAAVEPGMAVRRHVRRDGNWLLAGDASYDLQSFRRVRVVGAGKASGAMAEAVERLLGGRVDAGLVIVKDGYKAQTRHIAQREASHPAPDARGLAATDDVLTLVRDLHADDLLLVLLSGGGSALLERPAPGVDLGAIQATTELLLRAGASIAEVNAVRKHLSSVKGGGLARLAEPAHVLALVLSDVIGDPLDVIASGPLAADPTTYADACAMLQRFALWDRVPPAVSAHLAAGAAGHAAETPKPGDSAFANVRHVVIGNNALAAEAAVEYARSVGLNTLLLSTYVEGEAREVGRVLGSQARELGEHGRPLARPACLVLGGETTVTVRGDGMGGRNQEVALGAVRGLAGLQNVLVLSAATDGGDGPTDAAGAWADGRSLGRAAALGFEPQAYLAHNDAYSFFAALGDLLVTGPTLTNVNDLMFVYAF
jgi:hydroxypyruvate reductase